MQKNYFYDYEFGKKITLKDNIFEIVNEFEDELFKEVDARWKLVESAFKINHSEYNFQLANDLRDIYIKSFFMKELYY